MKNKSKIWITWERQRRNHSMCKELGVDLYEIVINRHIIVRYLLSILKTLNIIYNRRPSVLFVQNPSLILSLFSILLRYVFRYKLVVDEHNAGLYPLEGTNSLLNNIARYVAIKADNVIVSNGSLAAIVKNWGGKPLILPDPLPDLGYLEMSNVPSKLYFNIMCICTWSPDEPIKEIFEAAKYIKKDILIYITGRYDNSINKGALPKNIELTGFLEDSEYINKLKNSDAVIVLTNRDNCLNCGAYEAIAAEKPLILSDKIALRDYFNRGVVFTKNEGWEIAKNINIVFENRDIIKNDIRMLRKDIENKWRNMYLNVEKILFS